MPRPFQTLSLLLLGFALPAVLAERLVAQAPQNQGAASAAPFSGTKDTKLTFPADWSKTAYPIPVHSHNDYWQDVPVLTALSYGVMSIESDVWLNPSDKQLYVGHDPFSLTRERTFSAITIAPLVSALTQANRANAASSNSSEAQFFAALQKSVGVPAWNGFYSLGPGSGAAIQLLVDVKTDGATTWPAVVAALEPLRSRGWLTRYENGKLIRGAVTVIGTGGTPVEQIAPLAKRDVFIDGPIGHLDTDFTVAGVSYSWNATLCPLASGDFDSFSPTWKGVGDAPAGVLKSLIDPITQAHAKGIKTRYWDTPAWPIYARDNVNQLLVQLGSDFINADDLAAISQF